MTNEKNMKICKRNLMFQKIKFGINASTAIATPIAIKMMADKIEGDYEKKALYVTGGALWMYQIASTFNNVRDIKRTKEANEHYLKIIENLDMIEKSYKEHFDMINEMNCDDAIDVEYTELHSDEKVEGDKSDE